MLQLLAKLLPLIQKGVFKTAEGIGSVFSSKTPQALGHAFSGLKGASLRGGANVSQAFRGIGQGVQSGVYRTAEGLGKAFTQNPSQTFQQARSGLSGMYARAAASPFAQRTKAYLANYGPHMQNIRHHAGVLGHIAAQRLGGLFGGRVGRGAAALGAGAVGLGAMGMKGAGAVATAPFKAVGTLFGKLSSASGGLAKSAMLFARLAGPAALVGAVLALKTFVQQVVESNRGLAKWNGSIAASFNMLDIHSMQREMQTANATAGTTTQLNETFDDLLQEFQPLREDIGILVNLVATNLALGTKALIGMATAFIKDEAWLKEIVDGLHILEAEAKARKQQSPLGNTALSNLAAMAGGPARPAAQGPRPFLDDRLAPALTDAEKLRLRRLALRGG